MSRRNLSFIDISQAETPNPKSSRPAQAKISKHYVQIRRTYVQFLTIIESAKGHVTI